MMSTPRRASWCAISSFSWRLSEMPGDCSPSRRVVSKMRTRLSSAGAAAASVLMSSVLLLVLACCSSPSELRLRGRHALFPPKGEQEKDEGRELRRHLGGG